VVLYRAKQSGLSSSLLYFPESDFQQLNELSRWKSDSGKSW